MKSFLKTLWLVAKDPFRILNDFMFDNDAHHIVSKKGQQTLNKN
jgi:hypothetical protein